MASAGAPGRTLMPPPWLHGLSIAWLALAALSALVIAADALAGHPQKMWIMNIVWPVTALWGGPPALVGYYVVGRRSTRLA